ncbi:hypothetical protein [Arthrobacter psychrochitiniphilus]|uniref:hypothetical protein n=1 Tax=Arthrobacter psychrochitiniphilus TaxID=291045 RepID=UPI003F7BDDA8
MHKKSAFLIVPALALAALSFSGAGAMADDNGTTSYQANLGALNGSNATGSVMITLTGDQATVTENVSGLAATFDGAPTRMSSTSTLMPWVRVLARTPTPTRTE